jgi:hypothetical protein
MNLAASQFVIGASPVMILGGLVLLVNFGWSVGVNTVLGVALQTPVEVGGYGFTPSQNALCEYRLSLTILYKCNY